MKFLDTNTSDTLELPAPDALGSSVVLFNGKVVEHVMYSDEGEGSVTLGDGTVLSPKEWAKYLLRKLISGAYAVKEPR